VGVANVKDYWSHLAHHPAYVTQSAEVEGFLDLVEILAAGL
jgi:hypothetical protein